MAERFTLYAGEPVATVLAGYESNRSGRINQVCADYHAMIADAAPVLSPSQWCGIVDALNGTLIDDITLRHLWAEIADSAADGLGEKWGVDINALAQTVRCYSLTQLIALREIVRRYWAAVSESAEALDPVELLAQCGARFTG